MMVVTRFAPSPTGYLHIGGLRTALFSYLWAKRNGGEFVLRIEDTDKSRNSEDATRAILEAFEWVGLAPDGEITYQSQRDDIYKKYIDQLLEEGKAYKCYMAKEELDALREEQMARKERPRYDGRYRDFDGTPPEGIEPVIRIKAPMEGKIEFHDGIKGDMSFNVDDILDDFIIARSDGSPTYNFVVAIDDALMGINNVIRGDDHLSNTPKQIVVYNALDFELPHFFHVPMIHNSQGKKLSKRDGATDVMAYKEEGYTKEALLNFLVRLGWSHGDQEIFSFEEMLALFDPNDINKSASIYNVEKLDWLNAHYIKNMNNTDLAKALEAYDLYILSHDKKEILLDATKERAKTLVDLANVVRSIINPPQVYEAKAIKKHMKEQNIDLLTQFADALVEAEDCHLPNDYEAIAKPILEKNEAGMPKLAQPIRIAMVGNAVSPSVYDVMAVVGKDHVLERIEALLTFMKENA
jgi:glutamyl-tRNA synthetase